MSHIFISYNHDDGDFADNLKEKIREAGFEPWIDIAGLRAGEDWRAEVDQAIKGTSALIVVMTPKAKESEYVTYEWAFALGAGVKVIPILLKPTELHPRLEALQYLDFTNRMARPWDRLIEALQEAVDRAPQMIRIPSDVPPVIKQAMVALDSASPAERKAAIETLAQTDHPAVHEALAEAIQHPVRDVRIRAAFALIPFKDARAVPGLIEALRDKDESMRAIAAAGMGHIGDAAAVPDLIDALRDVDEVVGAAVAKALGQIGNAAAVPNLINVLRDEDIGDIDLCEAAVNAAMAIGVDTAVPSVITALAVVGALGQIGTPEALAAVEEWRCHQQGGSN